MFTTFKSSSLLLSLALFSLFIVIFFFTYAQNIEKKIIEKQIQSVVEDMRDDLEALRVPKDFIQIIFLNSINPNLEEEDKFITKNNKKLLKKASLIFGIIFIICVVGIIILYKKEKFNVGELIKKNLIVFFFVALIEIYFMSRIAKNYVSLDPNIVKLEVLKNIQKLGK